MLAPWTRMGLLLALLVLPPALGGCGDGGGKGGVDAAAPDAAARDAAVTPDGGNLADAAISDAAIPDAALSDAALADGAIVDAAADAGPADAGGPGPDATITRTTISPGWCPSTNTAPGYYQGTLAGNTNDIVSNSCTGSAPGRDGALRIELAPGQTVTATYRHAGDGILYILDSCPVESSCLAGSDSSMSGPETVSWTNNGATSNPIYVVLDSDSLTGPQTFELDLFVTP